MVTASEYARTQQLGKQVKALVQELTSQRFLAREDNGMLTPTHHYTACLDVLPLLFVNKTGCGCRCI